MRPAATIRRPRGLFVFLAFLLSLLQEAAQPTAPAAADQRLAVQLAVTLSLEEASKATVRQTAAAAVSVVEELGADGGPDFLPQRSAVSNAVLATLREHFLPPAT